MIIRQAVNFGAHLVGGVLLGVLAVAAATMCRHRSEERLEPRQSPPAEPTSAPPPPDTSAPAAAI